MTVRNAFKRSILAVVLAGVAAAQEPVRKPPGDLLGAWKREPGAADGAPLSVKFIEFFPGKVGVYVESQGRGQLQFAPATYEPGRWVAKIGHQRAIFAFTLKGGILTLEMTSEPKTVPGPMTFRK